MSTPEEFGDHVSKLQDTMFYVCRGTCLCGTINNRGKVIYCYGDLVPRHGEHFTDGGDGNGRSSSSNNLLAAQLGVWIFGILALLIVLIFIQRNLTSLRNQFERVTEQLPFYVDEHEDEYFSNHSETSHTNPHGKEVTIESMEDVIIESEDGHLSPTELYTDDSQLHSISCSSPNKGSNSVEKYKTMRLHRKDFKKGGEALRGKNVTEAFRIKEKDMKRTMK